MQNKLPASLGLVLLLSFSSSAPAQTLTDALMMPKQDLCTGFVFEQDRWSDYWEGTLKRDNQNIGTLTTRSVVWMGTYGVTDRLNVIAMLPYVSTDASLGVLKGMSGFQDLTVGLKYKAPSISLGGGSLTAFGVGAFALPASDYTPDFYPLSLGSASRRFTGRATLSYRTKRGLYVNGTVAHTWRDTVTLDRSSYYTDGHLYYSDEVSMPRVVDYAFTVGLIRGRVHAPISFSQQRTLGGGDIRRQDMPFVSNRMNASRVDGMVMYYLPQIPNLAVRFGAARTLTGRNVGQSTTLHGGLMYTFHFGGPRS